MKILIVAAAMLAALTSYPATAPEAAAPIVYAVGATVAEVDTAAQRITAEDTCGHLWDFYGTGYRAGAPRNPGGSHRRCYYNSAGNGIETATTARREAPAGFSRALWAIRPSTAPQTHAAQPLASWAMPEGYF